MPPLPMGKSGALLGKAMNKLGWHWWPSDVSVATTEYEGRAPCINLGHCTPACTQGAKASTDITYWPVAQRAGVELRTHCRVREITVNEHGMANGVVYYDADGKEQFQAAEVVVVACNGVGTPRLLLNSKSAKFPNGLANSSGLVGKNLMFHPYGQVWGYVDEETDANRAPPTCLWSKEFYETDLDRGFVRGYAIQFGRGVGPVLEAVTAEQKGLLPWGADHHKVYRRLYGHRLACSAICEDLPEEHNRVTLDPGAEGFKRHPGAEDRLHDRRQHREDDEARHRPLHRDPAGRRRARHLPTTRRSSMAAGTCSAPRGWATIPSARSSTAGAARTT